jgi:hypothetical protein
MTRASLWTNAAPLGALSRHWFGSGNFSGAENIWNMPYANTFRRGRVDNFSDFPWQIRLNEKLLPFLATNIRVSEFDELIAEYSRQGADDTSPLTVNGRQFSFFDIAARLPFLGERLTVSNGREMPRHRARGIINLRFSGPVLPQQDVNYSEVSEDLDGTARTIKREFVESLAMFIPRVAGVTQWGGVYVCLRHVLPRSINNSAGTVIDYTASQLINCALAEIGELSSSEMVPRDSIIIPLVDVFVSADCGLARAEMEGEGTVFQCAFANDGINVLEFPFVLPSVDSQLSAVLSIQPNNFVARPGSAEDSFSKFGSLSVFLAFARAPYMAIGEGPAFEIKEAVDYARLVKLSHFAGAAATPPHQPLGLPGIDVELVRSAEWGTWDKSLYPYTPHPHFIVSADGGVDLGTVDANRRRPTPIFALRDFDDNGLQSVEPYPEREVQVRAACSLGHGIANAFTPYADNAAYMVGKPANNDMVIAGKRITGVTVRLEPYAVADIEDVRVGVEPIEKPGGGSVTLTHNAFDRSVEDGWFGSNANELYWSQQSSTQIPEGKTPASAGQTILYNGTETFSIVQAADGYQTQAIQKGDVSEETEKDVVLFQHAYVSPPSKVGGLDVPETFVGLFNSHRTPVRYAPFTGEYQMARIQVGSVQTAGNWFHYNDEGEFSVSRAVEYNVYLRANTTAFEWEVTEGGDSNGGQFGGAGDGANASIIDAGSTFDFYDVPITEDWELNADHVEFHAVVEVRLQEAGTFNPNFTFGFGDERDELYASNEIFDQPRGRIRDIVTYTAGNEPRPAIFLKLYGRSVMRGSVSVSADTSNLPGDYPWSLSNAESPRVASMAGGVPGRFDGDTWETIDNNQSQFFVFEYQFNADQTEQLLNGQAVVPTRWAEADVDPNEPAAWVYGQGLALASKVSVSLTTEEAT